MPLSDIPSMQVVVIAAVYWLSGEEDDRFTYFLPYRAAS